ncbi:MAG: dTDP-4-dehydrorhamnose reductase [Alphaproteobacteria bacterium]|nr:dTDP-4-dehydrorhamnose reductase [Alphaproteobacteria bacterium]
MYLITGSRGQLGQELAKLLPDAILTDSDSLDITDADAVREFVRANNIETIINCAAYTAVDRAEDDADAAYNVNVTGPENLAKSGARVIHVSTDYVFDGTAHTPYTPDDATCPVSVYGRTKRAGEIAVLDNARAAIVIRTAWLYSPYGNNFVKTMRRLGAEKDSINVVCDQIGTPTCAADLARAIVAMLPHIHDGMREIYHFTNEGVCSWYDFACAIMKLSGLACHVNPIPSAAYPTRAARPAYSVLSKEKIKSDFNITIPHWQEALIQCLKQF